MSEYARPVNTTVNIAAANTQYSWAPPAATKNIMFKVRQSDVELRYAFMAGKVAGPTDPYMTLPPGNAWSLPDRMRNGTDTIYFAAASACVVEIEYWYQP